MQQQPVFAPDVPPDLAHADAIREEALDWIETNYPGALSFTTSDTLRMAGEQGKRWLIARLRNHGIGDEEELSLPSTADALTVLFLRSKGVKFREAVDAVTVGERVSGSQDPRYGGVWSRLVMAALDRLRGYVPPRLLASAVFALLPDPKDHPNSLVVVKRCGRGAAGPVGQAGPLSHEQVYRTVLERPAPACAVLSPSREVLFLGRDQLPTRSEITSRHFAGLRIVTDREVYELQLGTIRPAAVQPDEETIAFAGRVLDMAFLDFEEFHHSQSAARFETPTEPEPGAADELDIWMLSQLLTTVYPGSLCEISETSSTYATRVLANSAARPWEASPWEPAKSLEMLSGYASRTGVPLVVERVEHPWTLVIESVESEMRYLRGRAEPGQESRGFSAVAVPVSTSSGHSIGSLYILAPRIESGRLANEVRILTIFGRIVRELVERHRAATHAATVAGNVATLSMLSQDGFNAALLALLERKAAELRDGTRIQADLRLPFLLLSAHYPDSAPFDPELSDQLKGWLVRTLRHLEWRSFVQARWSTSPRDVAESFAGELPDVGILVALGKLVPKDELDRIRSAFPTTINPIAPSNAPVKLVAWVLDVPAGRITDAADRGALGELTNDVERWAFDVATVVDDVAHSSFLAHEQGEWDRALRRVRNALHKDGAKTNSYLRRIAAECAFSLGDWPSALRYAHEAVMLSGREIGSGLVRSLCLEADAHLCLCNPVRAWDLYSEAATSAPSHPLPRYYRGQALLLLGRLLGVYQDDNPDHKHRIEPVRRLLGSGSMEDLTSAADLLESWGLIPESYQYRNFHLVPTLIGQGAGYFLTGNPGPAASRLQSARRSFPKDDLFFREYLFGKCWEQGVHRQYAALILSERWAPLQERIRQAFGEPHGLAV